MDCGPDQVTLWTDWCLLPSGSKALSWPAPRWFFPRGFMRLSVATLRGIWWVKRGCQVPRCQIVTVADHQSLLVPIGSVCMPWSWCHIYHQQLYPSHVSIYTYHTTGSVMGYKLYFKNRYHPPNLRTLPRVEGYSSIEFEHFPATFDDTDAAVPDATTPLAFSVWNGGHYDIKNIYIYTLHIYIMIV